MIDLKLLEEVILDQSDNFKHKDSGLERDVDFKKYLTTKQVVVISGIRRSGKSTLLRQISKKLGDFYYINFDDERIADFQVNDFNNLLILWQKQLQSKNILIDEIQNVALWERFIRRVHDEGYKLFITGSNAKLLSSEFATHLTGRYSKIELYPFSFKEFLQFYHKTYDRLTSSIKAEMLKMFDQYLVNGGFPEYLKYKDKEFIQRTYADIIYKDIITRFGIREIKSFKQLAQFLFTNFTKEISYNSLKNILNVKSPVSIKDYIGFLQESYLVFELFKYDFSLKKQFIADKKVYVIDNGMRNNVAFHFSEDRGRLLENLVFVELKRRGEEFYFFKDKKDKRECDFVIVEKNKAVAAIQVTQNLKKENEKREREGIIEAMSTFKLKEGLILTDYQDDECIINKNKKITILPIWKWLLTLQ